MIRKISKKYFHFFIPFFLFFFLVANSFAESGYQFLADIPTIPQKDAPGLADYMKGLFTLFVGLAIVAAVIMIILGAVGYVLAAVPSAKSDGKNKIMGAIIGLLLVLVSTIILYTINPELLRAGLKLDKINPTDYTAPPGTMTQVTKYCKSVSIGGYKCFDTLEACEATPGLIPFSSCDTEQVNVPVQTTDNTSPASGNELANRDFLTNNTNISINAGAPQTQLSGVKQTTLNEVITLQQQCNCDIVVTAGSEPGHADGMYSHANGYKVDLRTTSSVSNYIMENYTNIGTRSDGAIQYLAPSGSVYALESDHWDVTVSGKG